MRDEGAVQGSVVEDVASIAVEPGAVRELGQVDADVERDERARYVRAAEPGQGSTRRTHAGAAGVLRAADPDRRDGHAVGADRPTALGAREAGLPVGVPVASGHAQLA